METLFRLSVSQAQKMKMRHLAHSYPTTLQILPYSLEFRRVLRIVFCINLRITLERTLANRAAEIIGIVTIHCGCIGLPRLD